MSLFEEAREQAEIQYMADSHEIVRVIETLSIDQAKVVLSILGAIRYSRDSGPALAGYYSGLMAAHLAQLGYCIICAKDHDAELRPDS